MEHSLGSARTALGGPRKPASPLPAVAMVREENDPAGSAAVDNVHAQRTIPIAPANHTDEQRALRVVPAPQTEPRRYPAV